MTAQTERNRCDTKNMLLAFVFGSRIPKICTLSYLSLCTYNPDRSHDIYSSISVVPEWPLTEITEYVYFSLM